MSIVLDGSNVSTTGVPNSGTAVASTSGTSIDFTGIPAGVKRITVMFSGVSTNGISSPQIQIGAGSVITTGYLGASSNISAAGAQTLNFTTGFGVYSASAANMRYGAVIIANVTGNVWVASGTFGLSDGPNTVTVGGALSLGGALDRVRITTTNGTDTFDAGLINILYE